MHIALESLRALTAAIPDEFPLPDRFPRSHLQGTQSAAAPAPAQAPAAASSALASAASSRNNRPPVKNGQRIAVYWTEDPVGWFNGRVTSSRREDDTWVSRVLYDSCDAWGEHAQWHYLDNSHEDCVEWNLIAGNANAAANAPQMRQKRNRNYAIADSSSSALRYLS